MEGLTLDQLQAMLIGIVVLIALLLGGLVLYIVLANRRKTRQRDEAQGNETALPAPTPGPTGRHHISLFAEPDGLQVEIGGIQYRTLAEIRNPEMKRQVVVAAMDLVRFTGVLNQDVAKPASLDETYRWREDVRKGSADELAQIRTAAPQALDPGAGSRTEVEKQFLSLLAQMGQTPPAPDKPGLVKALERSRRPKLPEEPPRTFVDDIEVIVQRRAHAIPALCGRDLHVRADPGGGVRFEFEGREYHEATDLPNMTARQVISEAIKEWEEIS